MRDKDKLERMIDSALASYGNPGAEQPGQFPLEQRVLAAVRGRIRARRTAVHWMPWAAGLAAACLIALLLLAHKPAPKTIHEAEQVQTPRTESLAAAIPIPHSPQRAASAQPRSATNKPEGRTEAASHEALPKLDVFPAPRPPSDDVEALAFFVRRAPPGEVKGLLKGRPDEPLTITELEIPPLKPLDEGGR